MLMKPSRLRQIFPFDFGPRVARSVFMVFHMRTMMLKLVTYGRSREIQLKIPKVVWNRMRFQK